MKAYPECNCTNRDEMTPLHVSSYLASAIDLGLINYPACYYDIALGLLMTVTGILHRAELRKNGEYAAKEPGHGGDPQAAHDFLVPEMQKLLDHFMAELPRELDGMASNSIAQTGGLN